MTVRETDDPKANIVVLVGIVGTIVLLAVIIATQALYENVAAAEYAAKVLPTVPTELRALKSTQLAAMNVDRWIDEQAGVVGIPIERAMEIYVREQAGE